MSQSEGTLDRSRFGDECFSRPSSPQLSPVCLSRTSRIPEPVSNNPGFDCGLCPSSSASLSLLSSVHVASSLPLASSSPLSPVSNACSRSSSPAPSSLSSVLEDRWEEGEEEDALASGVCTPEPLTFPVPGVSPDKASLSPPCFPLARRRGDKTDSSFLELSSSSSARQKGNDSSSGAARSCTLPSPRGPARGGTTALCVLDGAMEAEDAVCPVPAFPTSGKESTPGSNTSTNTDQRNSRQTSRSQGRPGTGGGEDGGSSMPPNRGFFTPAHKGAGGEDEEDDCEEDESPTSSSSQTSVPPPRRTNTGDELDGPLPNELELLIPRFRSRFIEGTHTIPEDEDVENLTVYSEWKVLPSLRFRLMVHPLTRSQPHRGMGGGGRFQGVGRTTGGVTQHQAQILQNRTLGAFVEIGSLPDWPADWIFQGGVRFHIYVVNLTEPARSVWKDEVFQFSFEETDRGWHTLIAYLTLLDDRFLDARTGDLLLRAAVYPSGNAVMSRSFRTPCPPSPLPPRKSLSAGEGQRGYAGGEKSTRRNEELAEEWDEEEDDKEDVLGPCVGVGGTGAGGDRSGRLSFLSALGGASVSLGRAGKGYVGLKNHGATCYMNALLQSLYYIGKFRQAVYAMSFDARVTSGSRSVEILEGRRKRRKRRANTPGGNEEGDMKDELLGKEDMEGTGCTDVHMEEEDARGEGERSDAIRARSRGGTSARMSSSPLGDCSFCSSEESEEEEDFSDWNEQDMLDLLVEEEQEQRRPPSISLALQNLFFRLYTSAEPVACKDLIRSFGWDAADAFTQQDTHELLKLLLDKVEEQMQGTPAEGSVKRMFEGEMETYIECIEVDYKSARKETFEDLNLDVKGCSGVVESLRRLVQPEVLEGENSYDAEQYGKQRAKKGVRFLRFPPVCIFLLKRFDFDYEKMDTVKVFSSFEFTRDLDLSEFCPDAGVYELHAVSVHQGDVNSGHYYCFLRPPPRTQWIRFDDDKVYPVSEYAAIGDNFGGEEEEPCNYLAGRIARSRSKLYNAYILVYVKKSQANQLLADCSPLKVNPQVVSRCRTEELLMRLRNRIRKVLEQRIKVKVYHPLQFINRRFLDLPLATLPPLLEIKSNRSVRIFPIYEQIVSMLWAKMYNYHPSSMKGSSGSTTSSPSSRGKQGSSGAQPGGGGGDRGEAADSTPSSSSPPPSSSLPPPVGFVLHVMDFTPEDQRFSTFELAENPTLGEIYRDKVGNGKASGRLLPGSSTPSSSGLGGSGGGAGGGGALGGVLSRFDACLHLLAVPEKNTFIRSFVDHDEFCRKHQLLFLKYFDVFNANRALWENQKGLEFLSLADKKSAGGGEEDSDRAGTGGSGMGGVEGLGCPGGSVDVAVPEVLRDPNILCLDVIHVPANWKLFCLQPHIYRCLLRAMDDGLVRPYAVEPLRRYVASLGALPPLFSAGPSAPSLFYPFVQPSLSENNVNNSEEDLKMSAAATSPGQNRTKALSSAAAVASLPSQSRKTSKGVSGGDEEERASGADGRGKTGASPGEGGEDKVESYLVDVSSSQSCSRGPCSAAAAAGVGTSMTYADHLHGSGAAGMREGGGSGLPDLPTDPDLAMILVLEIDFQDTKSPPNLMLSFKKTLTQEKIYPGDIFVFSLVAPEQLRRRFQETLRVAELEGTEADADVTEEFRILPPAQEGHQVLSRLYQVGRGLAAVPFLATASASMSLQNAFGRCGGSGTSPGGGLRAGGTAAAGGGVGSSGGSPGEATGFTSLLESTPGSSKAVSPNNPWGSLAGTQTAPPTPPAATGAAAEALSTAAATAAGDAGVPFGVKKGGPDSGKQAVPEASSVGGGGRGDRKEADDGVGRNGEESKGSESEDKAHLGGTGDGDLSADKRGEEGVAGAKKGESSSDKATGDTTASQGTTSHKDSPFFLHASQEGDKDRLSATSAASSEVSTAVSSAVQGRTGSESGDRANVEGRDASGHPATPVPSAGGAGDGEKTQTSELSPEASSVLPGGGVGSGGGGLPLPTSWSLNTPSGGGEMLLFLPATRGGYIPSVPPEMPFLPSADFYHYALNRANRFVFQFRLYDPLEMLSRPMNCCGMLLEDYPRPSLAPSFSTVSLLSREAGLSHCPSNDNLTPLPLQSTSPCQSALGGGGDNLSTQGVSFCRGSAGTPATPGLQISTPSPCSSVGASVGGAGVSGTQVASLSNVPLTPVIGLQRCGSGGGELHESGEGTETSGTSGEVGEEDEDPWVHLPKGRPVAAKMLEVDVRVACKQVIRYVSWYMGVDPSRLFLFPEPPLLSDTSFEPLSLDGLVYLASPSPEQQRRSEGGGHHGSQGGGASSQGGGLVPRRLSVNEVFNRLEKKALSSSLRFGRRRPLPRATSVFPAVLSSGPQGSRHRVFHLAVLPRHYSLCTRVIEPQLLTPTQQQKMKQLLFVPSTSSSQQQQQQVSAVGRKTSGAGETNSAPMVSIENEPVFHFVTLVLNRRVESIGCVEGLIASRCPLSGRPATVQDLIAAALVRMDKSLKSQLAQEITRAQSGQSAGGAGGGELFSSPDAMWTAAEGAGGGGGGGSQQQQALEASDADLASALRVVLASAAAVQPLERSQQLQSLPFYTSNTTGGAGRQQQGRGPSGTGGAGAGAGEHVAATQNLLAMPLRLELDWTVEEKDQLVKGTLKALQVAHQSPSDKEYFGSPFEILVRPDDTLNEIKRKVKEKLLLPKALWNNCTFFQYADCNRSWKGSNDKLDWQRYDRITLIDTDEIDVLAAQSSVVPAAHPKTARTVLEVVRPAPMACYRSHSYLGYHVLPLLAVHVSTRNYIGHELGSIE